MKFKKGNKVKVLAGQKDTSVPSRVAKIGSVGVVSWAKGDLVSVNFDKIKNGKAWLYQPEQLELIKPLQLAQKQVTKHHTTDESQQYGHPEFYKLLKQMAELHSRKNHDYAGTKDPLRNLKASLRIGIDPFTGVLLRLQDKWSRLESFMVSGEFLVKDESVEDTLMDNAVYSLLAIILRREQKNKKPEPK